MSKPILLRCPHCGETMAGSANVGIGDRIHFRFECSFCDLFLTGSCCYTKDKESTDESARQESNKETGPRNLHS